LNNLTKRQIDSLLLFVGFNKLRVKNSKVYKQLYLIISMTIKDKLKGLTKKIISNPKKIITAVGLAALIGIPYSYLSPLAYLKTNVEGTYNVLESKELKK